MKTIIQKFGGTSVANDANREKVTRKIIDRYNEGCRLVVVVSAIGRNGDPYATDSLISLIDKDLIHQRELDLLLSCGEIISAVVLSNLLNTKGYETIVLTGQQAGIMTNSNFGDAEMKYVSPENIIKNLERNKIVIVAGFQGSTDDGEITTLGRGGSDTSALILGEALNAEYVEIYTDVDGIMTADPKIVQDARVIENMRYSEVYQLAEDGAKVIHSKAVDIAERSNIEVRVKNTLNESVGTKISKFDNFKPNDIADDKIITAITYKRDRVQVIIELNEKSKDTEKLMDKLTESGISIDLINFFIDKKIFTIDKNDVKIAEKILISNNYKFKIIDNCCKLSTIGHRMRGMPGVMARIVKALASEDVDILQSSDSHTTIWCLIHEKDITRAIIALHKEFHLDKK